MSSLAHESIVSGRTYGVTDVDGATPTSLDDFVSAPGVTTRISLDLGNHVYLAQGTGVRQEGAVALYEKDGDGGKDLRVWCISATPEGGFTATHSPRF